MFHCELTRMVARSRIKTKPKNAPKPRQAKPDSGSPWPWPLVLGWHKRGGKHNVHKSQTPKLFSTLCAHDTDSPPIVGPTIFLKQPSFVLRTADSEGGHGVQLEITNTVQLTQKCSTEGHGCSHPALAPQHHCVRLTFGVTVSPNACSPSIARRAERTFMRFQKICPESDKHGLRKRASTA